MKFIVFEDKDAKSLVQQLELTKFQDYCTRTCEIHNVPDEARKAMINEIHRRFHYVVVNWLHDQGATTT